MDPERVYDLLMISLFVFIPEIFLITCLVNLRTACLELSNLRFFESAEGSISRPLLGFCVGLILIGLV